MLASCSLLHAAPPLGSSDVEPCRTVLQVFHYFVPIYTHQTEARIPLYASLRNDIRWGHSQQHWYGGGVALMRC